MTSALPYSNFLARVLESPSVRIRFIVSVFSNGSRAALSFASGMMVARALKPTAYGDLTFLLGSFTAFQTLLDLGTSNAFFTMISQRARSRGFFVAYFAWQGVQFAAVVVLVGLLCPPRMLHVIWLGHPRGLIVVAFIATFAQQQLWVAVSQIGEGSRQSVRVQTMNVMIATVHLILVTIFICYISISIRIVFHVMIVEYGSAIVLSYWFLRHPHGKDRNISAMSINATFLEYWVYCKPLAILSVATFSYFFADRWMLQRFGGGAEQGFYQVSAQFAGVALLATASILRIFWKEIAEAYARRDLMRVERMHRKAFRGLVLVSSAFSCLLIPWSDKIVSLFLSSAYYRAAPVLTIMFVYPILQTMGQINGATLLACGHTRAYAAVSVVFMLISIPATYFVQAPTDGQLVHGFGGGALGMAIKMVGLSLLSVNVQAWVLARKERWRFDWGFPFVTFGLTLALGYAVRSIVFLVWHAPSVTGLPLLTLFICCVVLYLIGLATLVWYMPMFVGMNRSELRHTLGALCGARA